MKTTLLNPMLPFFESVVARNSLFAREFARALVGAHSQRRTSHSCSREVSKYRAGTENLDRSWPLQYTPGAKKVPLPFIGKIQDHR